MAITDTFESYTDGQTLNAQTNWSTWSQSDTGVMTIDTHTDHTSGQVVDMSTAGVQYAIWQGGQVGSADHYVEIASWTDSGELVGGSGSWGKGCGSGPLLRMQSSSPTSPSGYLVEWKRRVVVAGGSLESLLFLYRVDSGTRTQLAVSSDLTSTYSATSVHTIRAEISGSVITATINGTEEISYDTASDGTKYTTGEYVGVYQARELVGLDWQPFFDDLDADVLSTDVTGTATVALPTLTAAATGTHTPPTITGTSAVTLPTATATASGSFTGAGVTGTSAVTLSVPAVAASGSVTPPTFTGTAVADLPTLTAAATGTHTPPAFAGTATATIPVPVVAATGSYTPPPVTGTSAVTLSVPAVAASGTAGAPGTITGTAAVTLSAPVVAAGGSHTPPAFTGTGVVDLPALAAAASGTHTPPTFTGTAVADLPVPVVAASGTHTPPTITGTAAVTLPDPVVAAEWTLIYGGRAGAYRPTTDYVGAYRPTTDRVTAYTPA